METSPAAAGQGRGRTGSREGKALGESTADAGVGMYWGKAVGNPRSGLKGKEEENTKGRRSRQGNDGRRFQA